MQAAHEFRDPVDSVDLLFSDVGWLDGLLIRSFVGLYQGSQTFHALLHFSHQPLRGFQGLAVQLPFLCDFVVEVAVGAAFLLEWRAEADAACILEGDWFDSGLLGLVAVLAVFDDQQLLVVRLVLQRNVLDGVALGQLPLHQFLVLVQLKSLVLEAQVHF